MCMGDCFSGPHAVPLRHVGEGANCFLLQLPEDDTVDPFMIVKSENTVSRTTMKDEKAC